MRITKTDFLLFLNCPESFWLYKNRRNDYPGGEFSLFQEKLIKEGYDIEEYAKQLFPSGIEISEKAAPASSQKILDLGGTVFFQPSFNTEKNLYARIDILEHLSDETWHLYEVKSSGSVKKEGKQNHIRDASFQKFVLTECGYNVSKVSVIHVNTDYIRQGEIKPEELLNIVEVTEEVESLYVQTIDDIEKAIHLLQEKMQISGCSCLEKTRSNHCDAFAFLNPEVPTHSIYELNRISSKKVGELRALGIMNIKDIPKDFELSERNLKQRSSLIIEGPVVNVTAIRKTLSDLKFPLFFIDYETYPSAIPKLDRLRPHQQLTFQVSIHTLTESGNLSHKEYLSRYMELPEKLILFMKKVTGERGTFVSWHASFEKSRNQDMIHLFPLHKNYLDYMNEHMFDLETIFNLDYVDYRFKGSTSIKYVLPILVPRLTYTVLKIQDGTMALDTWGRWVTDFSLSPQEKIDIGEHLLKYCEMDTLAMVEIYRVLKAL